MLGAVLTILKILGFILLGVIALALLIVLAVLFVPVRYRISGDVDIPEYRAKGSVSWLLHAVHASIRYDTQGGIVRLRIFGIPVWKKVIEPPPEKEKDDRGLADKLLDKARDKIRGTDNDGAESDAEGGGEAAAPESVRTADAASGKEQTVSAQAAGSADEPDGSAGEDEEKKQEKTWEYSEHLNDPRGKVRYRDVKPEKTSLFRKIGDFFRRIVIRVRDLIQTAGDLLKNVNSKKNEILGYVENPRYQEAARLVLSEIVRLLRHFRPRKIRGRLELGLDDPSATGMIIGAYYALYPVEDKYFRFTGNFEKKVIRGAGRLHGHIRIIHPAVTLLRLYRNDVIRELMDGRRSSKKQGGSK